jgi:GNAT superfamily N-acetyltransferase
MTRDDSENYRSILERTTEEDRYCRFFHAVDHFDPEFIERSVVERRDIHGFIALDDVGRPLGAAHGIEIDETKAELAVIVARDARRRGVARALVRAVVDALRSAGVREMVGYALRENRPFAGLAPSVGMQPDPIDDPMVTTWRLDLTPRAALR